MGRLEKVRYPLFAERSTTDVWWTFKLVKKHERGDMPKSEWLDKLVFRRMSEIHAVCVYNISCCVHTERGVGGDRKIEQPVSLY